MTNMSATSGEAASALSLPQRFLGILFSPRPTFESVVAWPKWLGMLLVTLTIALGSFGTFLWTETGRQAFIDQTISQMESRGQVVTAESEAQVTRQFPVIRAVTLGALVVFSFVIPVVISGVAFAIFGAILGGTSSFKQVLAVVVHAGVVSTVATPFVMLLNFLRGSMNSATNLAVFVPMLPEGHFLTRFLGTIDLIWILYLAVLAIGLGVLYRRKGSSLFLSFAGVYVVIALIIAGVSSAMGGS